MPYMATYYIDGHNSDVTTPISKNQAYTIQIHMVTCTHTHSHIKQPGNISCERSNDIIQRSFSACTDTHTARHVMYMCHLVHRSHGSIIDGHLFPVGNRKGISMTTKHQNITCTHTTTYSTIQTRKQHTKTQTDD